MECETTDGDIFYYNPRTKQSVWDHPFDSYYKGAIHRYQSGNCSKQELVNLVSQSWLLSGTDNRPSHDCMEGPVSPAQPSENTSPRMRRNISVAESASQSSILAIPPDGNPTLPGDLSPNRLRLRPSAESYLLSPTPLPSNPSHVPEVVNESELIKNRAKMNELTINYNELKKRYRSECESTTRDLIKSRDFIERLIEENKTLKKRMIDASSKVLTLKTESSFLREKLAEETRRRETAESRLVVLEDKLFNMEDKQQTKSIFSKFCGVTTPPNQRPSKAVAAVSRPVTPQQAVGRTSPDPYKEILNLLNTTPSPQKSPPAPQRALEF